MVSAWEGSGQSMTAWARTHGLKFERLRRWRRKLREPRTAPPTEAIELAPVLLRPVREPTAVPVRESAPAPVLDVSVGPGIVRVPADFDEQHLRRVVSVLTAC